MTNLSSYVCHICRVWRWDKIKIIIDKDVGLDIIKTCGKNCFATYWTIRSHKNKGYNSCYPSLKVLSKECDCSTRTIQRDIASLVENGFLFATAGHSGKNSNYYFIKETDLYTKEEIAIIKQLIKEKQNEI